MTNLPREPIPGRDRVAVRAIGACPAYLMGQRSIDDPVFGRIPSDTYVAVTWGSYYHDLFREGAIEVLGFCQGDKLIEEG